MILLPVGASGTIGKQVFPANVSAGKVRVRGLTLTPSGANAVVVLRDGNASGTILFHGTAPSAFGSNDFEFEGNGHQFSHGLHVKVLGANNKAYLYID